MLYSYVAGDPLLSGKWEGLGDEDQRRSHQELAERLLGLSQPIYTDLDIVGTLHIAIVLQVNFLLEQNLEPELLKSQSNQHPGNMTAYRDRYLSPKAAALVDTVTGRRQVRFEPPTRGV